MKNPRLACLALLILSLLTAPTFAGPLGKTIKGGLSYTTITHDLVDFQHEAGFVLGVAMNYDLVPGFSLQPEILYVQQGARDEQQAMNEDGEDLGTITYTTDLDYIQVPILLKVDVPLSGSFLPALLAGPAIAFNINAKSSFEGPGLESSTDLEGTNSPDVSLIVGLGMKLGAGPAAVNLEVRYNHGLRNIFDWPIDIQNRGIQAMVGYSF